MISTSMICNRLSMTQEEEEVEQYRNDKQRGGSEPRHERICRRIGITEEEEEQTVVSEKKNEKVNHKPPYDKRADKRVG